MRNSSTKIQKVDVDEDKTSETSETPKQIINELHTIRQYMEYGCSARSASPHTPYGSIWNMDARQGQHRRTPGEIDALANAHVHGAEDSLILHVAFPSIYKHAANRNLRLQTRCTADATTAVAATTTSTTNIN